MSRANRFLPAIVLISVGAVLTASHPEWGRLRGIAVVMLLLAGVLAIGVLSFRPRSESPLADGRASGQKVPKSLVSLSSAAILAIYAAGYHRTSPAEDKFVEQTARRRTTVPLAAGTVASEAAIPTAAAARKLSHAPVASLKNDHPKRSLTAAPNPAPAVTSAENSADVPDAPPKDIAATNIPAAKRQSQYKDGTYLGWGSSRHGDIQASVVIQGGQITSTAIAQCLTRYPCTWIADLPGLVVSRQSADVDFVSGATESSYAFSDAVSNALSKANE